MTNSDVSLSAGSEIWFLIIFSFGAFIGYAVFFSFLFQLYQVKKSHEWPSADGIITESRIKDSLGFGSKGGKATTTYYPSIRYEYMVDGIKYKGSRISIGILSNGKFKSAKSCIKKYPVGKQVKVYYFPMIRRISLLERGKKEGNYFLVGTSIGLTLGLVFSVLLIWALAF